MSPSAGHDVAPRASGAVISVVSGKGGSGKSLLTAVLGRALGREGAHVLLIDMDIFVRGLTVLLFNFRHADFRSKSITVSDLLGIFSEGSQDRPPVVPDRSGLLIERFLECDVLPAVDNIATPLDYDDRNLGDEKFCNSVVRHLVSSVRDQYDYVFLDNRAGMDSLIAASCRNADIVLSVAEDDDVGRQTDVNLSRFLQTRKYATVVYSIINKGRNVGNYNDLRDRARQRHDFSMLGVIPFDIDVLETFGSPRFWSTVTETLYFRALLDAWNDLAKRTSVRELSVAKYHFPPKIFMRPEQGRYSLFERMLRLYSGMFLLAGIVIWLYREYRRNSLDEFQLVAGASVLFGLLSLWLSTSGFQSLLRRPSSRYRQDDDSTKQ